MNSIEVYAARAPFGLDEFVAAANALLPQFLPDQPTGGARFSAEVNVRLVRHLSSLGLLDESGRTGREARYQVRHLLQLLAVRRLMAEGHTTTAIKKLTAGVSDQQLRALLSGETRAGLRQDDAAEVSLSAAAPSNAALDFLQKIGRQTEPSPTPARARSAPSSSPSAAPSSSDWRRVEIVPGLELHVREDFSAPATPHERELLLQRLQAELKSLGARRSRRR